MKRVITDYPAFYKSLARVALVLSVLSVLPMGLLAWMGVWPLWICSLLVGAILTSTGLYALGTEKIRRVRAQLEAEIARLKEDHREELQKAIQAREQASDELEYLLYGQLKVMSVTSYGDGSEFDRCRFQDAFRREKIEQYRRTCGALQLPWQRDFNLGMTVAAAVTTLRHDKRKGDKAIMEVRQILEQVLAKLVPDENKRKAMLFDAMNAQEKKTDPSVV